MTYSVPLFNTRQTMPPKSPIWELYIGSKTLYKTDQSHFNAWCNGCLYGCMKNLREADRANVIAGVVSYARTETELQAQGQ